MVNHQLQITLIQLLKDGHQVEVPAFGMSMFPLLLPGDNLLVQPSIPKVGDIGVFVCNQLLIAHRLYKIEDNYYYFKGDGLIFPDRPISVDHVLGTVTGRKRRNKTTICESGVFRLFRKFMPELTFLTGHLFFYSGRIYSKILEQTNH